MGDLVTKVRVDPVDVVLTSSVNRDMFLLPTSLNFLKTRSSCKPHDFKVSIGLEKE